MSRFLVFASMFLVAGLGKPAAAQNGPADGLPPRPAPFQFVNDQARLLAPADAKKLEGGLRRYADNTGTQVVVVTVPSLGGREVADYGRALGTAWGVGQRGKNNGVVVLLSGQERKVTIQPGSGLKSVITPAVTSRIIGEMTPSFKAGNYFAGFRTGLNTLMLTANPSSNPQKNQVAAANSAGAASGKAAPSAEAARSPQANLTDETPAPAATTTATNDPIMARPAPEPASSGIGMGTLLVGALLVGGVLWFLVRMFRNRNTAAAPSAAPASATPNFLPNRPNGPASGPGQAPGNYGTPNQGGGMMGGGMGGGMGMGGMLATGAAAAAGAYLGNRMASGSDTSGNGLMGGGNERPADTGLAAGAGAAGAGAAGAAGTGAASDFFSSRDGAAATPAPDYFADDAPAADNSSSDYFSSDDNASSYDDTSSNDTGGGGFDGDSSSSDDDSGSW